MRRHEKNGKSRRWLDDLARAIADGRPVDWDKQQAEHPEFAARLSMLRDIEAVGRVCQSSGALDATANSYVPHSRPAAGPPEPAPGASEPGQAASGPAKAASDSAEAEPHETGRAPASNERTRSHDNTPEYDDLAELGSKWGHLTIQEKIGEGHFGQVYRAYDEALDVEVALKLLRPDSFVGQNSPERLLKEARCLAHVKHPNVITVHGADIHDGLVGIWTDLLVGKNLEESLMCNGAFGAQEAINVGIELCTALAAIHTAGLVHGDVKATNAMRQEGGRIVLMDFGTARREAPDVFAESGGHGTPLMMAPELLLDGGAPTRASDIYSLGTVLFRLVTRDYPVRAHTIKELVEKHRRGEIRRLREVRPDLPVAFAQVVDKALETRPEDRFSTIGAMEQALRECAYPQPIPVPFPWGRLVRVAASVAALVGAGLAWYLLKPEASLEVRTAFYKNRSAIEIPDTSSQLRLAAGDSLFLQLESKEDVHLYVLNETASKLGQVSTLFPAELASLNPVRGGDPYRLPTNERFWEFDGESEELLLIVASRTPRREIEERIAAEFRDGNTPAPPMRDPLDTEAATEVAASDDDFWDQVDPRKVDSLSLRRLSMTPTPTPHDDSVLEVLAQAIREEMKTSKDVWCQIVRIEP